MKAHGKAPPRVGSLADLKQLKQLKQEIAAQQARQAAELAARQEAERRAQADKNLFSRAVGAVQPLPDKRKALLNQAQPAPIPVQQQRDEQAVLRESLSDEFDVSTLLDVDDALSFRRPGIGTDVTRKLRRGDWSIQREIDLHGLRREEARAALAQFIREAHKQGIRCLRVVHGKGLGSPGKTPVLKGMVQGWLIQKQEVLAFVQARPAEGGAGALVVLLKPG
ncbi:MAG: Smr/MutS family protein [Burkholderiaceae bacterium]